MGEYEAHLGSLIGTFAGLIIGAWLFGDRLSPFLLKANFASFSELRAALTAGLLVFGPAVVGGMLGETVQHLVTG